jgi:SAM-dependent methyltransferase
VWGTQRLSSMGPEPVSPATVGGPSSPVPVFSATELDDFLRARAGGRMLDVATGSGNFVSFLVNRLRAYDEVVAVDLDDADVSEFEARFVDLPRIRFETMDALAMSFPAESFDVVSISHALCEFDDADRATLLQSIRRLTKAGGAIVICDTPRDPPTEPELTHILLHDWWSEVDAHNGVLHRPFQTRADLIALVEALNLLNLRLFDVPSDQDDPFDQTQLTWIDGVIDDSLKRVTNDPALAARGIELRERMHRVGFRLSTAQVAIGEIRP